MSARFRDPGATLQELAEPEVLVVCPRCSERAVVRRAVSSGAATGAGRRLTCAHCALTRASDGGTSTWGAPVDPWFGVPLWLQADLRGHTLWAFNAGHVDVLRAFVAADQRERRPVRGAPSSAFERLPRWLTAAEHRADAVALLDRLAQRALP